MEFQRIMVNIGAVLRNSDFDDGFSSGQSSMSYWSCETQAFTWAVGGELSTQKKK